MKVKSKLLGKFLSFVLALAMVFSLMPTMALPAYAEDNGWTSVTTKDGVTTYRQDFSGSDVPADWVAFYQEPDKSNVHIVNGALTLTNTDLAHAKICTSAVDLSGAVSVEVKYSYKCITDNEEFSSFIVRNDISGATYNNITYSYYKTGLGLHEYDFSQYRLADFKITYSGTLNGLSNNDRICIPLFGGGVGDLATIDNLEIIVTRVPNVSSITLDAATTVGLGATKTLNATVAPANADQTVVWSSDDETIAKVDNNGVITGVKTGTTTIRAKATNGTSDDSDDKTATCLVTVQKSIVASAENVSATYDGEAHGISVNVTDPQSGAAIAFGKTEGTYDLNSSPTITNVEDSPLTVYYKITAEGYAEKTGSATVTLSKKAAPTPTDEQKPKAKDGLKYTGEPQDLVTAPAELPAGYEKVQYSINNGETWSDEIPAGTKAGDYSVKVKYVGDNNHADFIGDDISVGIVILTDERRPTAKEGLVYNGSGQQLVNAPKEDIPAPYTMKYAVTTKDEEPDDESLYDISIPEGTDAGTYYVWYKVVGDENNNGVAAECITVSIAHKLTKVPEVPATCEKTGVKQHWKDEVGTLYKDAEGKTVTKEAELKIPATGHSWDAGKVTKEPTTKAAGVKTYTCTVCKATKTESIPKLKATIKPVLVAKGIAKGKTAVNISWNKIKDADRYEIYMSKCNYKGKKYTMKKVKTFNGKTFKWTKKGLKKNTSYKFYVKALKKSGKNYKTVAKSKTAHFFTTNVRGKYTNAKSLKLKKSKITLKKGKSATIKGTVTKVKKSKKLATDHAVKLRFISNNPTVAKVNSKGKVTANKAGTATIYVQTINGIWKTCKVTVN